MSKFKVGDRVRVYFIAYHNNEVPTYCDDTIAVIDNDRLKLQDNGWWVHVKQCRKLIKKSELHPQDPRGYKSNVQEDGSIKCKGCHESLGSCGIGDSRYLRDILYCSIKCYRNSINRCQESKFKVGDFVWDKRKNIIGRISSISTPNGINVDFPECKYWSIWHSGEYLQKLNIKCEN